MDRYRRIEPTQSHLGKGAYGVVYKTEDTQTGKFVALKKIRLEVEDEGIPTTALREITLLSNLDHPNVVRLENVLSEPSRLYLVFELVDMDLKKYMDRRPELLSPQLVSDIFIIFLLLAELFFSTFNTNYISALRINPIHNSGTLIYSPNA